MPWVNRATPQPCGLKGHENPERIELPQLSNKCQAFGEELERSPEQSDERPPTGNARQRRAAELWARIYAAASPPRSGSPPHREPEEMPGATRSFASNRS